MENSTDYLKYGSKLRLRQILNTILYGNIVTQSTISSFKFT